MLSCLHAPPPPLPTAKKLFTYTCLILTDHSITCSSRPFVLVLKLLDKVQYCSCVRLCDILQQWTNLRRIIDSGEWKKTDSKNGITISRLSFTNNEKAAVKVKIIIGRVSAGSSAHVLHTAHVSIMLRNLRTNC